MRKESAVVLVSFGRLSSGPLSKSCPDLTSFIRFETHDICEQVLEHFNNHPMLTGDDNSVLQLRYADSQAQKKLKEESAAHRGFKANEYNMEAFGPASPFYRSPITPIYPSPLQSSGSRSGGPWRRQTSISPG